MRSLDKAKLRWLIFSGLAVIAAAFFDGGAVPIYNGLDNPDEPYRYVKPPSDKYTTPKKPTSASGTYSSSDITNDKSIDIKSDEDWPQVSVTASQSAIIKPYNTKKLTVKAVPVAPENHPSDGKIVGNVYRLTVTSDAGAAHFVEDVGSFFKYIRLRLPQGHPPKPVVQYRPLGGKWRQLPTARVGYDIYRAWVEDSGDYALAMPTSGAKASDTEDDGSGSKVVIPSNTPGAKDTNQAEPQDYTSTIMFALGGVAIVAVMVGIVLVVRHEDKK